MEARTEMAVPVRRPFDPAVHDLDPNFRLTRFADLKGLGCKVPNDAVTRMLEPFREQEKSQLEAEQVHFQYVAPSPRIGKSPAPVAAILSLAVPSTLNK